jgi:hypothetical protein
MDLQRQRLDLAHFYPRGSFGSQVKDLLVGSSEVASGGDINEIG